MLALSNSASSIRSQSKCNVRRSSKGISRCKFGGRAAVPVCAGTFLLLHFPCWSWSSTQISQNKQLEPCKSPRIDSGWHDFDKMGLALSGEATSVLSLKRRLGTPRGKRRRRTDQKTYQLGKQEDGRRGPRQAQVVLKHLGVVSLTVDLLLVDGLGR